MGIRQVPVCDARANGRLDLELCRGEYRLEADKNKAHIARPILHGDRERIRFQMKHR